jgi:hypothetical protein
MILEFLKKHEITYFDALTYSIITSKIKQKVNYVIKNSAVIKTKSFWINFLFLLKQNLYPPRKTEFFSSYKNVYHSFHVTVEILALIYRFSLMKNKFDIL